MFIDGEGSGFDFWIGKNVNHCYFGGNPTGTMPAPLASTIAYFARQDGGVAHILNDAWSSTAASAAAANYVLVGRARGTPSSPSAVQSTDYLGTIGFSGRASTGQTIAATMQAIAAEDFASNRGTKRVFSTILIGASSLSERLLFEGNGQAVFGNQVLLPAGSTAAGTAPLKLQSGSLNTTPENGALEYDGTHLYFTIGSDRKELI